MQADPVKYPRTLHLPWSPGVSADDKRIESTACFEGLSVVVTAKMDGENCTMYSDYIHARSINSGFHPSREWVYGLWGRMKYLIPEGWRVCGENLWAKHSIHYQALPDYFLVFSIWDESNYCLSWEETLEWCQLLGLQSVPVLYQGLWDEKLIRQWKVETLYDDPLEGYVVRWQDRYHFDHFQQANAKWVRPNHVQTDQHWMHAQIIKNEIARPNNPNAPTPHTTPDA